MMIALISAMISAMIAWISAIDKCSGIDVRAYE